MMHYVRIITKNVVKNKSYAYLAEIHHGYEPTSDVDIYLQ